MNYFVLVLLSVQTLWLCGSESSLIENGDFETANNGEWKCSGKCTLTNMSDSFTGQQSMKVSNRAKEFNGILQWVDTVPSQRYKLIGYIKLLNFEDGTMFPKVELQLMCKVDGVKIKIIVSRGPIKLLNRWNEIGGITTLPAGSSDCFFRVVVPGNTVIYQVDNISMKEVEYDPDWRNKADARIEQIRKANMTFNLNGANLNGISVEIEQTRHKFAFGSSLKAKQFLDTDDPKYKAYQDFFYDNFEWAVLANDLKWKMMEKTQGDSQIDLPLKAMKALQLRGIKLRGHCVYWGISSHMQDWVLALNATELKKAISQRNEDVVKPTKGILDHWDVNNENIHGDFYYEVKLNDPNITMEMFRMVRKEDPNVKLFLNDFGILGRRDAVALKDQALLFKEAGDVPIYGIGLQSHLLGEDDLTSVMAKLDIIAEVGLPIWITELSVIDLNVTKRASVLSDLLKIYFSHPAVEGVILWGYWDEVIFDPNYALATGPNMTENEAAFAYKNLVKKAWRTNETLSIAVPGQAITRAFLGEYTLRVKHDDQLLGSKTFQLDTGGVTVDISLTGDDTNPGDPQITFS